MVAQPKLVDGELAGGGIFTTRPTRPGAHVGLARRADHQREGRRRRPWRHGGAGRWRDAEAGHENSIKRYAEHRHTTMKLLHSLSLLEVVGDVSATTSWRGGELW